MDRFIFLDRDGVINKEPKGALYIGKWEEFRFIPGVFEAIRDLNAVGFKIVIISNQAGVAKGLVKHDDLMDITSRLKEAFKSEHCDVGGIFYCEHDNSANCNCRKPKTGLFEAAVRGVEVDKNRSFCVGDSERDIQAAAAFGLKTVLVLSGRSRLKDVELFRVEPDKVCDDLKGAAEWILSQKAS